MPLFADGLKKIRNNLLQIQVGERPKLHQIGKFTASQLSEINARRRDEGHLPLEAVIVFLGRHLYKSRCKMDGYSIEEVLVQVSSAFSTESEVDWRGTALINRTIRIDLVGNEINDQAVFECTHKHPYAELLSVIPRGDGRHTRQK